VPDCIARKTPLNSAREQAKLVAGKPGTRPTTLCEVPQPAQTRPAQAGAALAGRALRSLRARKSFGLAALILLIGCDGLQTATADGDTRTLSMHHIHTDENITITFKRNGRYDEDALKKLNWFLRDWRRVEETNMDPHLFDLIWEVSREVDSQKPVEVVCGYRSPQTNAMLRRRSGGVARFSQHMLGRAMDFFIPGAALEDLRVAGLRLQRGGVGFYPTSGSPFVHLDTGSVRHWPRMTREQLVRVFPDGRTVHVPSDGRPLQNYALALADIEKRGNNPSLLSLNARTADLASADKPKRSLLAALFDPGKNSGNAGEDEENDGEAAAASAPAVAAAPRQQTAAAAIEPKRAPTPGAPRAAAPALAAASTAPAKTKQPATYELASVPTLQPGFAPVRPAQVASLANVAPSANDVISSRGYWDPAQNAAEQRAKASPPIRTASAAPAAPPARSKTAVPAADPKPTASIGPWSAVSGDVEPDEDAVPADVALAYAAQHDTQTKPVTARATPMGALPARPAAVASLNPAGTTSVLPKSSPALAPPPAQEPALALPPPALTPAKVGDLFDDPWMRALVVAPDIRNFMTVTSFDAPDFRQLRPMMEKPVISVRMTFSPDPQLAMTTDHFSGSAVVFLSTVNFLTRTASLQ